jgi:hypothetical protein
MTEKKRTVTYVWVALGLFVLALVTTIPGSRTPKEFFDQGEPFYPNFTDPNTAATLEVVDFNEETGAAIPFKVTFENGKWIIPSHYNYPANGKDRLAKTAAGVIDVKKDDYRTDNPVEYEALGVIDPLDQTVTNVKGRGKRVTIKGTGDRILADFIIGKKVESSEGMYFVRVPSQKRVYAAKMDIDISSKFSDWIDSDLLKVTKDDIQRVTIKDYSINERTRLIENHDVIVLTKKDYSWSANKMLATEEVDNVKMNDLLTALDELSIVDVRPKPEGLTESLQKMSGPIRITQSDVQSLQSKGFYFTQDGALVSNEGEIETETKDGVVYILRFGEVVFESGETAAASSDTAKVKESGENRYMFMSAFFDNNYFKEPPKPTDTNFANKPDSALSAADQENKERDKAYKEWQSNVEKGHKIAKDLNDGFAKWYYVISSSSFDKIHKKRKDLVIKKTK